MRWFMPRNDVFLGLLDQAANNVARGASHFRVMLESFDTLTEGVEQLKRIEHGDDDIRVEVVGSWPPWSWPAPGGSSPGCAAGLAVSRGGTR